MADRLKEQVVALIPRLRGYAMSLTRSESEADRLVEATLRTAWRTRGEVKPGENLQARLFALLRQAHAAEAGWDGAGSAAPAVDQAQVWRDRYAEMLGALDRLPQPARDALLLVAASGVSYEEAARIFGVSVGAMRSRVQRARASLAQLVGPGEEPKV